MKQSEETEFGKRVSLCEAAQSGSLGQMRTLLASDGADINELDEEGMTPLMLAAHYINEKKVKLLLENYAKVNEQDLLGCTALIHIVRRACEFEGEPQLNIVEMLRTYHANPGMKNYNGEDASDLIEAAEKEETDSFRIDYLRRVREALGLPKK